MRFFISALVILREVMLALIDVTKPSRRDILFYLCVVLFLLVVGLTGGLTNAAAATLDSSVNIDQEEPTSPNFSFAVEWGVEQDGHQVAAVRFNSSSELAVNTTAYFTNAQPAHEKLLVNQDLTSTRFLDEDKASGQILAYHLALPFEDDSFVGSGWDKSVCGTGPEMMWIATSQGYKVGVKSPMAETLFVTGDQGLHWDQLDSQHPWVRDFTSSGKVFVATGSNYDAPKCSFLSWEKSALLNKLGNFIPSFQTGN